MSFWRPKAEFEVTRAGNVRQPYSFLANRVVLPLGALFLLGFSLAGGWAVVQGKFLGLIQVLIGGGGLKILWDIHHGNRIPARILVKSSSGILVLHGGASGIDRGAEPISVPLDQVQAVLLETDARDPDSLEAPAEVQLELSGEQQKSYELCTGVPLEQARAICDDIAHAVGCEVKRAKDVEAEKPGY